jgi:hypothetical protein
MITPQNAVTAEAPGRAPHWRRRRRTAPAILLMLLAPLAIAQSGTDDFSDADLDGGWIGTIALGKSRIPFQLTLNVEANGALGFLTLRDPADPVAPGIAVFAADVSSVNSSKITFRIDDTATLRAGVPTSSGRFGTATFKLTYKAANDVLTGKATGSVKGKVSAVRLASELPMQRLWHGSYKLDGASIAVKIASTEDAEGVLGGHATFADETATLTGTRKGTKVEMIFQLGAQEIVFSGKLKAKNSALQGSFKTEGDAGKAKLVAGAGNGKAFSFKKIQPAAPTVAAGESAVLTLLGKHFAPGAMVFGSASEVPISAVEYRSGKEIRITVDPDADVADGTLVDLRVLNGNGRSADRGNAFAVTADDSGGGDLVSFEAQIQPILSVNCALAGCHGNGSSSAGLTLGAGAALSNLVNVPSSQQPGLRRVDPGNPDDSYLVRKIEGGPAITGGRMPLNRTPLAASEIALIRLWIAQGANG